MGTSNTNDHKHKAVWCETAKWWSVNFTATGRAVFMDTHQAISNVLATMNVACCCWNSGCVAAGKWTQGTKRHDCGSSHNNNRGLETLSGRWWSLRVMTYSHTHRGVRGRWDWIELRGKQLARTLSLAQSFGGESLESVDMTNIIRHELNSLFPSLWTRLLSFSASTQVFEVYNYKNNTFFNWLILVKIF